MFVGGKDASSARHHLLISPSKVQPPNIVITLLFCQRPVNVSMRTVLFLLQLSASLVPSRWSLPVQSVTRCSQSVRCQSLCLSARRRPQPVSHGRLRATQLQGKPSQRTRPALYRYGSGGNGKEWAGRRQSYAHCSL